MSRARRVPIPDISLATVFGRDAGVQGLVLLAEWAEDASGNPELALLVKDIVACERSVVAAAGLDPEQTRERFAKRVAQTPDLLRLKIHVVLPGEWSRCLVRPMDVVWIKGRGVKVQPCSRPQTSRDDHLFQLSLSETADAEMEVIARLAAPHARAQPTYEPTARLLMLHGGRLQQSRMHIARALDAPARDSCTPLASLDSGEASVAGVLVGQTFPCQTRGRDFKSTLYLVDESRPSLPVVCSCFLPPDGQFPLGALGSICRLNRVKIQQYKGQVELLFSKATSFAFADPDTGQTWGSSQTPLDPACLAELTTLARKLHDPASGPDPQVDWWPMQKARVSLAQVQTLKFGASVDLLVRCVGVVPGATEDGHGAAMQISELPSGPASDVLLVRDAGMCARLQALGLLQPGACMMVRAAVARPALSPAALAMNLHVELVASDGASPGQVVATSFIKLSALPGLSPATTCSSASSFATPTSPTKYVVQVSQARDCAHMSIAELLQLQRASREKGPARPPPPPRLAVCAKVVASFPAAAKDFMDLADGSFRFAMLLEDHSGRACVTACDEHADALIAQVRRAGRASSPGLAEAWAFLYLPYVWLDCELQPLQASGGFRLVAAGHSQAAASTLG